MSEMVPLAVYGINVIPGEVTSAIDSYPSATVKITSVAVHPESLDGKDTPTTLIMLKRRIVEDEDNSEVEDSDDDEEEKEDSEEGDEDEIIEEFVVATLSPEGKTQQNVDLTISPDEDIAFVATGSYRVDILGNYVTHPYDFSENEDEEYNSEDDDEEYSDEYGSEDDEIDELDEEDDLDSEDEAYLQKALEDIEDASDVEGKINELINDVASKRKRAVVEELPEETEEKPAKQSKKQKKEEAKKVAFKEELVEGPTTTKKEQKKKEAAPVAPAKPKAKQLEGGIVIEDRTIGKGKQCKKGDKVGMRYIGKLKKNEKKVFDKNVKGKPFVFNLGKGDVIKGWDIGVAGMAVGGERRIIIPAAYAYGKTALPGIPANSDLIFDVKLVSMK